MINEADTVSLCLRSSDISLIAEFVDELKEVIAEAGYVYIRNSLGGPLFKITGIREEDDDTFVVGHEDDQHYDVFREGFLKITTDFEFYPWSEYGMEHWGLRGVSS